MDKIQGRVILASSSPRRKEIFVKHFGFSHVETVPSGFPENLSHDDYAPFEYPIATATHKALDVYKSEADADIAPSLLVAADTVIECNGVIMEKPRGVDHHVAMLKQLRDAPHGHHVYTGVVAIVPFEKPVLPGYALETALGSSTVFFRRDLTDEEIIKYVATGEGREAAGGYMIQGKGRDLVAELQGELENVIGLPVSETKALIDKTYDQAQEDEEDLTNSEDDGSYF